ncbi:MAG TPA: hypothetical protein VGL08_18745 [Paraburkholderia sp.]|jgi:hypothetical protein
MALAPEGRLHAGKFGNPLYALEWRNGHASGRYLIASGLDAPPRHRVT